VRKNKQLIVVPSPEPEFVNIYGAQESNQGINSAALGSIAVGTSNRVVVPTCPAGNRFHGSLKDLQIPFLLFIQVARNEKLKIVNN
jgi:hypothetical protein